MTRSWLALVAAAAPVGALAACNAIWGVDQLQYGPGGTAAGTGEAGGTTSSSTPTASGGQGGAPCVCGVTCAWGPFGAASPVPNVNSADGEIDVTISADERTLYFARGPASGADYGIWAATRTTPSEEFGIPAELGEINTTASDMSPDLSTDGTVMFFASSRPGGLGDYDLWFATRADGGAAFGSPVAVSVLNADGFDADPSVSADRLTIYFSSVRPEGTGGRDLWTAIRTSPTISFGTPSELALLSSGGDDYDPAISADGLELFFATDRDGQRDIWVARRERVDDPFATAEPVAELNTDDTLLDSGVADGEWAPGLSADGRTLYFVTNRPESLGSSDIWRATRTCP